MFGDMHVCARDSCHALYGHLYDLVDQRFCFIASARFDFYHNLPRPRQARLNIALRACAPCPYKLLPHTGLLVIFQHVREVFHRAGGYELFGWHGPSFCIPIVIRCNLSFICHRDKAVCGCDPYVTSECRVGEVLPTEQRQARPVQLRAVLPEEKA